MCQKFTCFKIIIKNVVGRQLSWALALGASEERKLLAREENVLVLDEQTVCFFEPCISNKFLFLCSNFFVSFN